MAEISLRAYQNKLDDLARASRFNEVIAHARHILAAQPKNLCAHQQLGSALAGAGQWEAAADVLRRALGVQPGNFQTHLQLARVYEQLGSGERAIWHAERAYDQSPNDADAAGLIRSLYREQRGQQVERLQLTASALAQQQIRGNLLDEAIVTLDEALNQQPKRIDLQLLRARVLWLNGQRMDAAEAAADILEQLPNAIDANRILAELWLAEKRPSDAAPFLQRIEELDPYLARQLATGEPAQDGLIMIEELPASQAPEAEPRAIVLGAASDSLSEARIDELFQELVIGESVAAASELPQQKPPLEEPADLDDMLSQLDGEQPPDENLDGELADLLAELDTAEEGGDWMTEIQRGANADEDASLEYVEDFDREWVAAPETDDSSGAPWLSAAMREVVDQNEDGAFDLFGDDQGLQSLLQNAGDTQPIDAAAIEDWLDGDEESIDQAADEAVREQDEDILMSPPADSWLETEAADGGQTGDSNQLNVDLIDGWTSELGEDDEDDPYVDWLSDDLLTEAAPRPVVDASNDETATERARAWGLDDPQQLADFVETQSRSDDREEHLNVALPGLDRQDDAQPDDPDEFASPSTRGGEFGWLSDIVDEETGAMPATETSEAPSALYFRFSRPPAWMQSLRDEAAGEGSSMPANILDEDIEALQLDDLTFDDYFNFSSPTDKLNALSLAQDADDPDFAGLDWDDYFDLESPTEKTIAITLDDAAEPVDFDELGVDDDDFDFAKDSQTRVDADKPAWLEFEDRDLDDVTRSGGRSAL
ncbi:MAG: tetratricopeptide repeat protein [Chloroflexi bacterium]|nr:tetratricopeptide repeat protein [Chloroflexota bacterium]MCY4246444.1 tetratricopeptide repeat protein [Chloroflexota bacterium]